VICYQPGHLLRGLAVVILLALALAGLRALVPAVRAHLGPTFPAEAVVIDR
jgi:hypothetical protein